MCDENSLPNSQPSLKNVATVKTESETGHHAKPISLKAPSIHNHQSIKPQSIIIMGAAVSVVEEDVDGMGDGDEEQQIGNAGVGGHGVVELEHDLACDV